METLTNQVRDLAQTGGETRDNVLKIQTTLEEQNLAVRVQRLADHVDAADNGLRQDFVAANTNMRREGAAVVDGINKRIDGHDKRIDLLEKAEDRRGGTGTIWSWLATHGLTMVISALTAIAALLGLRASSH